jgi:hypothetical protein
MIQGRLFGKLEPKKVDEEEKIKCRSCERKLIWSSSGSERLIIKIRLRGKIDKALIII